MYGDIGFKVPGLMNPNFYSGRIVNLVQFTATGNNTYIPFAGSTNVAPATHALVFLWGAGAGGGSSTSSSIAGGAGGGGALAISLIPVVQGTSYTISIGTGGTGQAANNGTAATDGGNTTFNTNIIVAAGGTHGTSAAAGAGGTIASSTGQIKIAGGNGNLNQVSGFFSFGGNAPYMPVWPFNVNVGAAAPNNQGAGGLSGYSLGAGGNGGSGYAMIWELS